MEIKASELIELYINQGMSQRDIAKHLGVGQSTIRRHMKKHGIQSRSSCDGRNTDYHIQKMQRVWRECSENNTKKHVRVCMYCGKEYTTIGSKDTRKMFCSTECNTNNKKSKYAIQYCALCEKEIHQPDIKYKRKYCDECKSIYRGLKPSSKIKTSCGYCGETLYVIPSLFSKNINNYCDKTCMAQHYKERFSGDKSPTWKGGKSHHYIGNFYSQRKLARERDKYTCQMCGITESDYKKELSVHHIVSYRKFNNKAEANVLSNLISLCEKCHRHVHSNKNLNKQFIEDIV